MQISKATFKGEKKEQRARRWLFLVLKEFLDLQRKCQKQDAIFPVNPLPPPNKTIIPLMNY